MIALLLFGCSSNNQTNKIDSPNKVDNSVIPTSQPEKMGTFGIHFSSNNDLFLSDSDIEYYSTKTHKLKLTQSGVDKIDYQLTKRGALENGLYKREFIIRINGAEEARGVFWSLISSQSPPKGMVVIPDADFCTSQNPFIQLYLSRDSSLAPEYDIEKNQNFINFFKSVNKLVY